MKSSRVFSFVRCPLGVVLCLTLLFIGSATTIQAAFTALPDDVIESDDVAKADIPQHFKDIFGREGTKGEIRYWETRLRDKPRELEFLATMRYWAAKGESPTIETSNVSLTFDGTGRDIFVGQTRRHIVKLSHTNPAPMTGFLDIKVNLKDVKPTPPLPNVQKTYEGGVTRLRHSYALEPEEELTVDFVVTAALQPTYTVEAIVHGKGVSKQHVTKVYGRVPETLARPTYHQRQIPLLFARVHGRTPSKHELQEWRKQLTKTKRLDRIESAMIDAKKQGTTLPTGVVLGATTGINLEALNSLFRAVYDRTPTASEWHYWASRIPDKAGYPSFFGALQYHDEQNMIH